MIKIKDLNGEIKTVTDLDEAIKQTRFFKDLKHEDPSYHEFDAKQNKYWNDLFEKLIKIKKQQEK